MENGRPVTATNGNPPGTQLHPALKTQLKSNPIQPQNRASRTAQPQNEPPTRGANYSTEPVYVGQLADNPTFSPCAIPNNKNHQFLRKPKTRMICRKIRNLISTTTYVTVTPTDESPQADLPIRSPTCQKNGRIGQLRPQSPSETPMKPHVGPAAEDQNEDCSFGNSTTTGAAG